MSRFLCFLVLTCMHAHFMWSWMILWRYSFRKNLARQSKTTNRLLLHLMGAQLSLETDSVARTTKTEQLTWGFAIIHRLFLGKWNRIKKKEKQQRTEKQRSHGVKRHLSRCQLSVLHFSPRSWKNSKQGITCNGGVWHCPNRVPMSPKRQVAQENMSRDCLPI